MMRPINSPETHRMHRWKVAPAFFDPEGHHLVAICDERSYEGCRELVCYAHRNLVVPGVRIKKTEGLAPYR
jgi:hypothetical protein